MAALPPLSRSFCSECHVLQEGFECVSSTPRNFIKKANDYMKKMKMNRRSETQVMLSGGCAKTKRYKTMSSSMLQKKVLCPVWYASETDDSIEVHQRSLDTYFGKLKSEAKQVPASSVADVTELDDQSSELQEGLMSLERYLGSLKKIQSQKSAHPLFLAEMP